MNSIKSLILIACVGISLAVDCGPDTKQKTEVNPDNRFYKYNFWANNGATSEEQEERDAILGIGRSVWMKPNACFVVKAKEAGDLIMLCADTKFADEVTFKYRQGGAWFEETETISDSSVRTRTCFNRFQPVLPDVDRMRICFSASENVKLRDVYASMCVA